jgi:hypothetical protein
LRVSSRKDARSGPFGSRSSAACKVSSLRCSHVDHLAGKDVSSPSRPRVYDMRCPSRSGWGEASILSDQGGGSSPGKTFGQAPDP